MSGGRRRGERSGAGAPRASVVVCVHDRRREVVRCLDSLAAQEGAGAEIVVVDDGSTDGSPEAVRRWAVEHPEPPLVLVENEENLGVSGARNAGLDVARGDLVLFLDSDCTAEPDWVAAHLAGFDADPELAAAGGTVIDDPPENLAERAYVGTCRISGGRLQGRALVGNNMAFRRRVVDRYRFDPALAYGCDEDELAWRLRRDGHRLGRVPAAVVRHHHRLGLAGFLAMGRRQGKGSARFWFKSRRWLGRDVVALVAAVATLPLGLLDPRLLAVPATLLALHLAALLFAEVAFKGKPLAEAAVVLPVLLAQSAVKAWSALATLARILAGREPGIVRSRRAWEEGRPAPPSG